MNLDILVLPGDGIGAEVTGEAVLNRGRVTAGLRPYRAPVRTVEVGEAVSAAL